MGACGPISGCSSKSGWAWTSSLGGCVHFWRWRPNRSCQVLPITTSLCSGWLTATCWRLLCPSLPRECFVMSIHCNTDCDHCTKGATRWYRFTHHGGVQQRFSLPGRVKQTLFPAGFAKHPIITEMMPAYRFLLSPMAETRTWNRSSTCTLNGWTKSHRHPPLAAETTEPPPSALPSHGVSSSHCAPFCR